MVVRDAPARTAAAFLQVVLFALCLANFALFFILAVYLGGDAVNGKIVDGHYFLMSHGQLHR